MKPASPALVSYLAAQAQAKSVSAKFADCYTITLSSGQTILSTGADVDISYGGQVFAHSGLFVRGLKYRSTVGLDADQQDIVLSSAPGWTLGGRGTVSFPAIRAINCIPGSGEFTYDTVAYSGQSPGSASFPPINTYYAPGGARTDFEYALDQLQASLPNCENVAIVVQWFTNSTSCGSGAVYPSSTYKNALGTGAFRQGSGAADSWRVSDVTLATSGFIQISVTGGNANYGGTPSDQSIVRAIQAVKARGLKPSLYLFLAVDLPGKPWRGTIAYSPDVSAAATSAVASFFGSAAANQFTRDAANLTVHYSGSVTDFTYRRFVLHYAHLAVLAGGVSIFCVGSEFVGMEGIRGPAWTPIGATDGAGKAVWDYPWVSKMSTLISDVRGIFDAAGLTKNLAARQNLITYSPDWSSWMGAQHSGTYLGNPYAGVWPNLDILYASANVDFVSLDNYMPLSDWTTGTGGLDAANWSAAPPASWPPSNPSLIGFGLTGTPNPASLDYLQANIEGGEKFNWFYSNYAASVALDPNGSGQYITKPQGDRLSQSRNRYYSGQELFAFKNIRWWWNNTHKAVYDNNDGNGAIARGPATQWVAQSKSVGFMEYGFPSVDKCTNAPNVFYDPTSSISGGPFWGLMQGATAPPVVNNSVMLTAHQAVSSYWARNNAISSGGVAMIAVDLMFAWAWDARSFPAFPQQSAVWADAGNWQYGHWLTGKVTVMTSWSGAGGVSLMQAIINGAFDGAQIRRNRVFFSDYVGGHAIGDVLLFKGLFLQLKAGRPAASATVANELRYLEQNMPRNVYGLRCNHTLYDSGCGLSKPALGTPGAVGSGSTASVIASAVALPTHVQGLILFTSGIAEGIQAQVLDVNSGAIALAYPLPVTPAVGDSFVIYPGCDHTKATCEAKFNNLANFRGHPFIPSPQQALTSQ